MTTAELTDDLINEIIFRLPVKTLLRFRCVSKHFCSVIDSKNFINKHLRKSILTKTNQIVIFQTCCRKKIYSSKLHSLDQSLELVQPVRVNDIGTMLFGSCNGLLALLYYFSDYVVVIWNPATRKHVEITLPKFLNYEGDVVVFGFGYDHVSDDYKVVIIHQSTVGSLSSVAYVYTLRSNAWRKLENVLDNLLVFMRFSGALICGALHWVMVGHNADIESLRVVVGVFDLMTEEFRMFWLPNIPIYDVQCMLLAELDGFLSYVFRHNNETVVDVWVMKEYGVVESWTKLLSFSDLDIVRTINVFVTPLAYSESGDEVLLMVNWERLLWYDMKKGTYRFVDVCGLPKFCRVRNYIESLVTLGEKTENNKKRDGEKKRAKAKRKDEFLSSGFKLVL